MSGQPNTVTLSDGIARKLRRALQFRLKATEATAKSLRRLQLFDSDEIRATRLSELAKPKGRWKAVDPALQLMLMARDEFLAAQDDPKIRLGYFKLMQDNYASTLKRNGDELLNLISVAQRQAHHQDEMEIRKSAKGDEPSDEELERMAQSGKLREVAEIKSDQAQSA